MFSTVCALPSPASAEGLPPLFGWFKGSTAQSDFSCTFMSAVRFMAFADRSWSVDQDVQDISWFSCMLFLSVRGFLDYAGPSNPLAITWLLCCLPPLGRESASCSIGFSKLNSPAHRYLCLRFKRYLAISPARLEARIDSLLSFPVGLFHPLQHAGLSRRSPNSPPRAEKLPPQSGSRHWPASLLAHTGRKATGHPRRDSDDAPCARARGLPEIHWRPCVLHTSARIPWCPMPLPRRCFRALPGDS